MEDKLPKVGELEIKDIAAFVEMICDNPERVIILPRVHAMHVTTLFLVIEHLKRTALEVACETQDFRTFDRLVKYLDSIGL